MNYKSITEKSVLFETLVEALTDLCCESDDADVVVFARRILSGLLHFDENDLLWD